MDISNMSKKGSKRKAKKQGNLLPTKKKVHWGDDTTTIILPSNKASLKKAIQKGNVAAVLSILEKMDTSEAKEVFMEKCNGHDRFWIKTFFYTVSKNATNELNQYDNISFQKVLKNFMDIDFLKTRIAFHSVGCILEFSEQSNYFPLIREDFAVVEKEYESARQRDSIANEADANGEINCDSTKINNSDAVQAKETESQQNSDLFNEFTNKDDDKESSTKIITEDSKLLSSHILNHLLSWIYELPKWLQDQILQSSPVKSLIESIEQAAAIYNKKSVEKLFITMQSSEFVSDSLNEVEDKLQESVKLLDTSSSELVDTSMIYKEATVSGWILPTVIIMESGDIFGDSVFNGLLMNFNGLNGIEGF